MAPDRMGAYDLFGFSSAREYGTALKSLPTTLVRRFFLLRSCDELAEAKAESKHSMKQCLTWFDLVNMGIGMMLGAGVFVTTGYVAAEYAGPSVILSYIIAGLSALLSGLCYAEFAVDFPFAGSSYTYISAALGEFLAWITVANMILEYILSGSAAIRGFAPYFAALVGKPHDYFLITWTSPTGMEYHLDWWAFGITLALTVLLILGTKETSLFNNVMQVFHVALVLFIIIAGFIKSNPANAVPFFPKGPAGSFVGASIVFFSYIGFDTIATSAEEVRDVSRDLPLGLLGGMAVTTVLYVLMSTVLVMMVPFSEMPEGGMSFADAFRYVGLDWAAYVVGAGACVGIVTTTLIGTYGVSRIVTAVARDHLLPPFLARVHPRLRTPVITLAAVGIVQAVIALFTDFAELADMVSISTLFCFWVVALGLLWRRTHVPRETPPHVTASLLVHLALLVGASVAFTASWMAEVGGGVALGVTGGAVLLVSISFAVLLRPRYVPERFRVPLYPFLPCFSVFLNTFLLGQLRTPAWIRFGIWTAFCCAFYLLYSMLATQVRDERRFTMPLDVGSGHVHPDTAQGKVIIDSSVGKDAGGGRGQGRPPSTDSAFKGASGASTKDVSSVQ